MAAQSDEIHGGPVRLDEKGRVTIPADLRKSMGLQPGDIVYCRRVGAFLQYTKAINPFDALAVQALEDFHRGATRGLREIAEEYVEKTDTE